MKRISEEIRLEEFLDKMMKGIKINHNTKSKGASYTFVLEGDDPGINPNSRDIVYTVNFSRPSVTIVPVDGHPSMKIMSSSLSFSNDQTSMSTMKSKGLEDVNSLILFSSVAAIVLRFFDSQSWADGINFVPAHSSLNKAYKILSKEATRKGDLVWTNPNSSPGYHLVRGSIYKEFLRRVGA